MTGTVDSRFSVALISVMQLEDPRGASDEVTQERKEKEGQNGDTGDACR